jgi:hypothetical protein
MEIGDFMTGIIAAIFQIFAAYWIFKSLMRWSEARDAKEREKYLKQQIRQAKLVTRGHLQRIEQIIDNAKITYSAPVGELDRMILQDALNREARAKASLRAVLEEQGCTEAQIDEVMERVDNQQHGL